MSTQQYECERCPLENKCKKEKELHTESWAPEYRNTIRTVLQNVCPLWSSVHKDIISREAAEAAEALHKVRLLGGL